VYILARTGKALHNVEGFRIPVTTTTTEHTP
jgi:hypothetical protein